MKRGDTKRGLARALATEETDGATDAVVRAFWTRAKPVGPMPLAPRAADVVDLRRWALSARARATS